MGHPAGAEPRTLAVIRRVLALLLLAAMAGTTTELLLLEHDEDLSQLIPLALLAAGAAALITTLVRPRPAAIALFRALMVLLIAGGGLGLALHFKANLEFQRELTPDGALSELIWKALAAKTPPALAPGTLAQLGCLGLIYAYRLPAASATGRQQGESNVAIR
jgi:hypothetical protein